MMTEAARAAAASQLDACETHAQSLAHFASHEPNHNLKKHQLLYILSDANFNYCVYANKTHDLISARKFAF